MAVETRLVSISVNQHANLFMLIKLLYTVINFRQKLNENCEETQTNEFLHTKKSLTRNCNFLLSH